MKRIVNFLFEAGMLKRTPRTGFQFLGSGAESVAEHIFRTVYIGFALGKMAEHVDTDRVIKMCLFHDLPEARTGGMPQFIYQQFCSSDFSNLAYINAGEDWGIEGLRRAKMSYHPCVLAKKFLIYEQP